MSRLVRLSGHLGRDLAATFPHGLPGLSVDSLSPCRFLFFFFLTPLLLLRAAFLLFFVLPYLLCTGLAVGADAKKFVTPEIVDSIGAETFSLKAIEAQYSLAASDVVNRLIPILNGRTWLLILLRVMILSTLKSAWGREGEITVRWRTRLSWPSRRLRTTDLRFFVCGCVCLSAFMVPHCSGWRLPNPPGIAAAVEQNR